MRKESKLKESSRKFRGKFSNLKKSHGKSIEKIGKYKQKDSRKKAVYKKFNLKRRKVYLKSNGKS